MFENLIDYFGKARAVNKYITPTKEYPTSNAGFERVNKKAMPLGYLVHPDACTYETYEWLDTLTANYNASFYKSWTDVIENDRFSLYVDQIRHYASTYGTDMQGTPYVPNDNFDKVNNIPFDNLKVIEPISESDLHEKCLSVLYSGIALKESTVRTMAEYVMYFWHIHERVITSDDIDLIKNKEAQAIIASKLNVFPSDPVEALRAIVYTVTGKSLLIKNKEMFDSIRVGRKYELNKLPQVQLESFATVYNRFKKIFISMKAHGSQNAAVVNKIAKLSKKLHKPMVQPFWNTVLSEEKNVNELSKHLPSLTNFQKVKLINACVCNVRKANAKEYFSNIYNIRNGKTFVKLEASKPKVGVDYLCILCRVLFDSLRDSLKAKACKVYFSHDYTLAMPTSEKSYLGNYPFGTKFHLSGNNVIGIYWRNEWGTRDFDLSVIDNKGDKIGWDSDYIMQTNDDIPDVVFSGDMTNANPQATELLYIRQNVPDSIVMVNQFSHDSPTSKFRLFFSSEDVKDCITKGEFKNHMVDPNTIKLDIMVENVSGQKVCGVIHDSCFTIIDAKMGNSSVSCANNVVDAYREELNHLQFLGLEYTLSKAGFTIVDKPEDADIDFSHLQKDTIINLMKD